MNKEKLMQVLSELIDKGANIHVHLIQFDGNSKPIAESEALRLAKQFQEAVNGEEITTAEHEGCCSSFRVNEAYEQFYGVFSHSPVGYMIEDVMLDGGSDVVI